MSFRHYLTLHFCPLIARLVLAATFIWFGFGKFQSMPYTGEDAGILISLGVGKEIADDPNAQDPSELPPSSRLELERRSSRFAFTDALVATPFGFQEEGAEGSGEDEVTEAGDDNSQTDPADVDVEGEGTGGVPDLTTEPVVYATDKTVKAAAYHKITLMLHRAGHSSPAWMALLAVLTEAVGGILIFVGLFTRIWGLGLAIAMSYAFYLTTWVKLISDVDPLTGSLGRVYEGLTSVGNLDFGDQISAFFQFCCFGLALIVFLGGPGRYSMDHLIFRARSAPDEITIDEE